MNDDELARLEALAEKATAGPWEAVLSGIRPVGRPQNVAEAWLQVAEGGGPLYPPRANAEFIAASRAAVPALIEEVRRLRKWLAIAERNMTYGGIQEALERALSDAAPEPGPEDYE